MNAARRQGGDSRVGSMLALVGCLAVLGATFGTGVYTGVYWSRSPAGSGRGQTELAAGKARGPAPQTPTLTFYQELTAPLGTAPGPPAGRFTASERRGAPEKSERRPWGAREARTDAKVDRKGEPPATYTVQVAAYGARAPAEALRAAMTSAGHDAYVVEMDPATGGARYRVRVGSFATRVAASATAARLRTEGQRSSYVTTR